MKMDTLLLALLASLIFLTYHFLVRPWRSSLANLPAAHWTCHFSSFWILRARKNWVENRSLLEAHRKHGPVVRVGPNDVSVDGADMLRTVYQGGFEKDGFYSVFNNYGVPCMFSELASKPHSLRKKMISHIYSKSYLQSSIPLRHQTASILHNRLLPLLASSTFTSTSSSPSLPDGRSGSINVQSVFLAASMDFISAYIHGLARSTDFLRDEGYRSHWLRLYNARNEHHFWPQELPGLTKTLDWIGIKLVDGFVDQANAELAAWNWGLCEKSKAFVFADNSAGLRASRADEKKAGLQVMKMRDADDPADEPVVFKAVHAGIDKEGATQGTHSVLYPTAVLERDKTVASELFDHVLAGQETSGITLTYLAHHLSRNPALQSRLRDELLTLDPPLVHHYNGAAHGSSGDKVQEEIPSPRSLDALPLLHACLLETLRLNAPIPGPQPRRTPHPSCLLSGYEVPGGVRVAALAHSLHRAEDVFAEADKWRPERWLECSDEKKREMMRWFWAFGSGGRMCIGSNFAVQAMKYVVASIYTNFTTSVADDTGIEQGDGYTARPASDRLYLKFEAVASATA